jgi:iron-sulfur cluster repair protein YtfE (RIC family)
MNLIDALLGEHAAFYALFDEVENRLPTATTAAEVTALGAPLARALVSHARLEDELLFPVLANADGPGGPLEVMHADHQEIHDTLDAALRDPDLTGAADSLQAAIDLAREHFAKEEQVLFPHAREIVDASVLEDLGAQWSRLRGVSLTPG